MTFSSGKGPAPPLQPSAEPPRDLPAFHRRLLVIPPPPSVDGSPGVRAMLESASPAIQCVVCSHVDEVCEQYPIGAGAIVLSTDAISAADRDKLLNCLRSQPAWSDIPVVLLVRDAAAPGVPEDSARYGNAILVEIPARPAMLIGAARAGIRLREAQYVVRDQFALRDEAVRAQRESDERFRLTAAAIGAMIYDVDLRTGRVQRTAALGALLGYEPDREAEPTTIWWRSRIHPDDIVAVSRLKDDAIAGIGSVSSRDGVTDRDHYRIEYRERHRNGHYITVLDEAIIVRDPDTGRATRMVGCVRDITEQKRAEQSLRDADRRVIGVLERITDAFIAFDRHWKFIYLNPQAENLIGRSASACVGQHIFDVLPHLEGTTIERECRRAAETQQPAHFEWQAQPGAGRWHEIHAYPSPEGFGIYFRDITADRDALSAIRDSEERLRLALEAGNCGVWEWDIAGGGQTIAWSEQLYPIHGVTRDTFGGTFADLEELVHEDDRPGLRRNIDSALNGPDGQFQCEFRIIRPNDGAERWLATTGRVTREATSPQGENGIAPLGRPLRMRGVTFDITDRRRGEMELATRAEQGSLVASLGSLALSGAHATSILDFAAAGVARTLGVEYSAITELLVDPRTGARTTVPRAMYGWPSGSVGHLRVSADDPADSQAAFTLSQSEPVIIEDFWSEARFRLHQLVLDGGISSSASLAIPGSSDAKPYGVLSVHSVARRRFSVDDVHFLQSVANLIAAAVEGRAARLALRESEERLQLTLDASQLGTFRCDLPLDVIQWSERCAQHLGMPKATIVTIDAFFACLHPEDRERTRLAIERAVGQGEDYDVEYRTVEGDRDIAIVDHDEPARERWIRAIGRVFYDAAGAPARFDGITIDITENKKAQAELHRVNAELRQFAETLEQRVTERTAVAEARAGQLREMALQLTQAEQRERRRLAHVLHDHLQQILVAAKMRAGMIRQSASREMASAPPGTAASASGTSAVAGLQKVDELLNQAIDASRSLTGELNPTVLQDRGFAAALQWAAAKAREDHHLETTVTFSPNAAEIDQTDVRIAPLLLQAVRELLFNVVKHAKASSARLTAEAIGAELILRVEDDGEGFDAAQKSKAFPTSEGFGLSTVRERLKLMNGRFEIESAAGKGTRATIVVPMKG